ncbi:MAG: HAMP domain-containing histidine kinase [Lachnospiraceae bacterium]|nr:HAMP domain-containing histidine kinase [Lachnospiraceae bacterium]
MKLRTKVIMAFFVIIILPLSVMFLTFYAFTYLQLQEIQNFYGVELEGYEAISNSVQLLNKQTTDVYIEILEKTERDPGALEEPSYQRRLNDQLQEQSSYLIVKKNDRLVFRGELEKSERIVSYLPPYGSNGRDINGSNYVTPEKALVRGVDFICADGAPGSAFIVTDINEIIPQLRELFSRIIGAIIVIMVITAFMIMIWIYRSMINPIHRLQTAVNEISQGNLEYKIGKWESGKTEFGQLYADFDNMRRQLKQSNEDKEKFHKENRELIANISHDLKTPITSVKGYIEGIRDGVADTPEKRARYLSIIYNKAMDMDRLINELNIYSKIDTNTIQYSFQFINISGYFSDCVEEVGMDLQSKNIELSYYDYTNKKLLIKADPEQLKRVVNNVIGNSVKYMDKEKGFINIYIKDIGKEVQVEIEDNGKGIAQEDIPRIFERFYRTDASRNSAQGGSGIGLSIVKKIIQDHGGKLWASSREKKGTTIYFTLKKYSEEDKYE